MSYRDAIDRPAVASWAACAGGGGQGGRVTSASPWGDADVTHNRPYYPALMEPALDARLTLRPQRSCASSPGPREGIPVAWTGRRFGFPRVRWIVVGGIAREKRSGIVTFVCEVLRCRRGPDRSIPGGRTPPQSGWPPAIPRSPVALRIDAGAFRQTALGRHDARDRILNLPEAGSVAVAGGEAIASMPNSRSSTKRSRGRLKATIVPSGRSRSARAAHHQSPPRTSP